MMVTTFNDTYEIKHQIGKGGMSTVYLAEHTRLHTKWAVKEVRKNQAVRFDFLAEANILKRLQHPMLPRIVDIYETAEAIYVVEDFVEGITLDDLLRQEGKVDEAQGLQWYQDLCGVLRYLHNQQPNPIIYRDMKPSNIMLQPDGTLKLIDFGIAREYKEDSSADTTYVGTRGYAAPEQFGKAQTDARTDIYALGVTMYHLLTGKSPYEPPYQFVPARQLVPGLSHGTEYILNKCVQSEPSDRYQSVDDLLYDLEHIYLFDKAWKKYRNAKRIRVAIVAVMLAGSIGLMVGGQAVMAQEKEDTYARYIGENGFPALISPEDFQKAQDRRKVKAVPSSKTPAQKELRRLCGGNPPRYIEAQVLGVLNRLAAAPETIQLPDVPQDDSAKTKELRQKLTELLEEVPANEDAARKAAMDLAAEHLNAIGPEEYETERLRQLFDGQSTLKVLDADLLRASVRRVSIRNRRAVVELKNGQIIEGGQ